MYLPLNFEALYRNPYRMSDVPVKIKYPLPCGCAGLNFISQCKAHQMESIDDDARRMGIADVTLVIKEPIDGVDFGTLIGEIRAKLKPGKKLVIHLLHRDET